MIARVVAVRDCQIIVNLVTHEVIIVVVRRKEVYFVIQKVNRHLDCAVAMVHVTCEARIDS